jgi:hypothetical protein
VVQCSDGLVLVTAALLATCQRVVFEKPRTSLEQLLGSCQSAPDAQPGAAPNSLAGLIMKHAAPPGQLKSRKTATELRYTDAHGSKHKDHKDDQLRVCLLFLSFFHP